jgi:PAS domain-containing protein
MSNIIEELTTYFNEPQRNIETQNDLLNKLSTLLSEKNEKINRLSELSEFPINNPFPILRIDHKGYIKYANKSSNILLKFWDVEITEKAPQHILACLQEVLYIKKSLTFEEYLPFEKKVYSLYFSYEDSLEHINIYAREISESKEIMHNLETQDSLLKSLITNLNSAVLLEDKDRKIILTNKAFCEYFNVPQNPENLIGFDCNQAGEMTKHLFKNSESFLNRIQVLISTKTISTNEEIMMEDGRTLERDFIPIFSEGEYLGHYWNYRDITDQRKSPRKRQNKRTISGLSKP